MLTMSFIMIATVKSDIRLIGYFRCSVLARSAYAIAAIEDLVTC